MDLTRKFKTSRLAFICQFLIILIFQTASMMAHASISHTVCAQNQFQNKISIVNLGLEYSEVELSCKNTKDKNELLLTFSSSEFKGQKNEPFNTKTSPQKQILKSIHVQTSILFNCLCQNEQVSYTLEMSPILLDSKKVTDTAVENINGILLQFKSADDSMSVQNRILGPKQKKLQELWAKDFMTQKIFKETSQEFEIINDFETNIHSIIYREFLTYSDRTFKTEDLKSMTDEDLVEDELVQILLRFDLKSEAVKSTPINTSYLIFISDADDKRSLLDQKILLKRNKYCESGRLVLLKSSHYSLIKNKNYSLGYVFSDKETAKDFKSQNSKCPGLQNIVKLEKSGS